MTILLFIITLSLLVLVHEWGHFYVARKLGIRVEEFGFGFPPRLASIVRRGTRFVFNLFPIGGYVKIYGECGAGAAEKERFASRPVWQRLAVVSAGVAMNIVLAWVLFSTAHSIGITGVADDSEIGSAAITVIEIERGSPADIAGFKFGDVIRELRIMNNELRISSIQELQAAVKEHAGEEIAITLARNGNARTLAITPRSEPPPGAGPLGIALEYIVIKQTPIYRAPWDGLKSTYHTLIGTVEGLAFTVKNLIVERTVPREISGPVGIFILAEDIRELGNAYILQFIAILSVNLAVLNFLPIPALDGGRALFMLVEKIRRRAISAKYEAIIHATGFALLILLMILITVRDIRNIF